MLTPNEFQKIVDQINGAFDKANARIDKLEKQVTELKEEKEVKRGRPKSTAT
jgi:polyhydroxyalkanoate synthesis regulator phasin